jgi:RNA polymerase sigma factor (sigma-70 family)
VRALQHDAIRLATVISGSRADADDIAQEAFVSAHRSLHRYRPEVAPFRTWLLSIVANEARNHRRAQGRRHHYELALATDPARGPVPPVDPGDATAGGAGGLGGPGSLGSQERDDLLAAVRALPDRQRDVVACRYLLELSEAETAAVLDLAPGTVKSHLSRALARLRTEVARHG